MSSRRLCGIALTLTLLAALAAPSLSCPTPRHSAAMREPIADTLRLELEVAGEVPLGSPVPVVIRARNLTDGALTLYLVGDEIVYDLLVWHMDGTLIYRRLEGQAVPMVLRIETIAPREALTLMGSWDQRTSAGTSVGPGSYRIQGELPTDEAPLRTPTMSFGIRQ